MISRQLDNKDEAFALILFFDASVVNDTSSVSSVFQDNVLQLQEVI